MMMMNLPNMRHDSIELAKRVKMMWEGYCQTNFWNETVSLEWFRIMEL